MLDKAFSKINSVEKKLGFAKSKLTQPLSYDEVNTICHSWQMYDTTLFVGDNLAYLQALAAGDHGFVDVCYIDPPYNTGTKLLYNDNRKSKNMGPFGTHTAWLQFMLPRLVMAHALLKSKGIIAISIDDYEYAHLKILMDRVFGEANFIGDIIVCRSKGGKGSKDNLATTHEHLLIYGKSKLASLRGEVDEGIYDKHDEFGQYRVDGLFRKKGEGSLRTDRPNMYYPIYCHPSNGKVSISPIDGWREVYPVDSKGIERRWIWGVETATKKAWQLYASKNGVVYIKNYAGSGDTPKRTKVRTIWTDAEFHTEKGTNELKELFGKKVFDTPKPLVFIKKIIDISSQKDAIILDFFAGSGTTAHAAAEMNADDGGTRRCILMESDCHVPDNHVAMEMGFSKIADITEYRLRLIKGILSSFCYKSYLLGK